MPNIQHFTDLERRVTHVSQLEISENLTKMLASCKQRRNRNPCRVLCKRIQQKVITGMCVYLAIIKKLNCMIVS